MKKILAIVLFAVTVAAYAMIPDQVDRIIALTTLAVLSISLLLVVYWDKIPDYWSYIKFLILVPVFLIAFAFEQIKMKWTNRVRKYKVQRQTNDEEMKIMLDHLKEEQPLGVGA